MENISLNVSTLEEILKEKYCQASKMAQWVKEHAARLENLSLIFRTLVVEEKIPLPQAVL